MWPRTMSNRVAEVKTVSKHTQNPWVFKGSCA